MSVDPNPSAYPSSSDAVIDSLYASNGITPTQVPSATTANKYDTVFMGYYPNGDPVTMSKADAAMQMQFLPPDGQKKLADLLDKQFGGRNRWTPVYRNNFIDQLVNAAAFAYGRNGQKISPLNVLESQIEAYSQMTGDSASGRGGGGGRQAPTKAVNLTDPGTAKTLLNQSLEQYLGRQATPEETEKFTKALGVAEMKSPTDTTIQNGMVVRSGGFNPATFAQDYAAGMEGSGEYQAVTSVLDTFISSLANPVRL